VLRAVLNKQAFQEALVQLIVLRNLPYNAVEWPELQALLMTVNYTVEDLLKHSHGAVPQMIDSSFVIHKNILKQKLRASPSKSHFSIDVWTSPNHKAFQAICAHSIDSDSKQLQKALLALPELQSHSGEEQAAKFLTVAEDYGLLDRIGYFTGDNHGSNDKMCRFIARGLQDHSIMNWNPIHHCVRCQGHVINLAVQAFLFSKDKEAIDEAAQLAEQDEDIDINDALANRLKKAKASGWR
jgi:hypothetical protein